MKSITSINILLGLLVVLILFHLAIIIKAIPYDIAWGGRLHNDMEMYVFEVISILIILILGIILLMKGNAIKVRLKEKTMDRILWVFLVLFILDTLGNIFAKTNFEKSFAVLTFVFAFLIWTILKRKNIDDSKIIAKTE